MPSNLTVLGHSPIPLSKAYTNQGTWGPFTYSDMTYYTDPRSHAGIIDTGDNNWINAMGYRARAPARARRPSSRRSRATSCGSSARALQASPARHAPTSGTSHRSARESPRVLRAARDVLLE